MDNKEQVFVMTLVTRESSKDRSPHTRAYFSKCSSHLLPPAFFKKARKWVPTGLGFAIKIELMTIEIAEKSGVKVLGPQSRIPSFVAPSLRAKA